MKWFKHDTDTDSDPKIKLLKKKFKAAGYGIYFEINRLIAKNVDQNISEWGYLPIEYTDFPELLVEEVAADNIKQLQAVINYCIELKLLYRHEKRILNPKVLSRSDRYTAQIAKEKDINLVEYVQKLYGVCTETKHTLPPEENRLKIKEEKKKEETANAAQKREYGNPDVNEGIDLLRELFGSVSNMQKNRYALNRLYKAKTKERVLKGMRFAHKMRQVDNFCPSIMNYIELEQKWDKLEDYARRIKKEKKESEKVEYLEDIIATEATPEQWADAERRAGLRP